MIHPAIEGESTVPPVSPDEGECWLVGTGGTGAWDGEDGKLACFEVGNWLFIAPRDGMTILVVEHDMTFIRQIAQRVTVLHLGRVFAQDTIGAIVADARVAEIYLGKGHVD